MHKPITIMKHILLSLLFFLFSQLSFTQNVGIGTTAPQGKLQINQRSNTAPGVLMVDSSASGSGSIRFRQLNNTVGMTMAGYSGSAFNLDNYIDVYSDSAFIATFRGSGHLGVRNASPVYPLDVTGDINTTASLRVNGDAGTNGQVLRSNGNGTMQWDDMCEFKNYVVYNYTTLGALQPFIVPAGVTKIKMEIWGGGGYGTHIFIGGLETAGAGGGGGGYITGYYDVTVSSVINVVVGGGGVGATGGNSRVEFGSPATKILTANGGGVAVWNAGSTRFEVGAGGGFSATGTTNYRGIPGETGYPLTSLYEQRTSTDFIQKLMHGNGGNAANTNYTGGRGGIIVNNITTSTFLQRTNGTNGAVPGGGGASVGPAMGGSNGGNGMVIIYY
jgi:hypothetical protein